MLDQIISEKTLDKIKDIAVLEMQQVPVIIEGKIIFND